MMKNRVPQTILFGFIILMIFIKACAKNDSETKNSNTSQEESVKFVVVGGSGTILTSSDSNTWISENSGTSNDLESIHFGDDTIIVVGDSGTILTSIDGDSWTSKNSGNSYDLNGVSFIE
ncbi:MAG: WD40/YVTN/BNR-like repeat-containing protein [bacterium]